MLLTSFLCSPIDPQPFFFCILAASPARLSGRMGQNSSRRLAGSVLFFSWLLLLQDGIYARYFTAGVLVDDIVDGFRFGADQEPRKMLSDLRPEFLQRPAS